ncbi:MAG: hypothetical protein F4087_11035 [Gemmatimonadetes bacterium]|nr:hypothetical protein [Gemmatimonadota bacterium]MYA10188.1 hypothetical protein [Gemmatimonadota bacterium]MYD14050.1 hypothetical protein [Gemmatimonadota bacterium]MYE71622.1 hypothetical protein [Gemmatimonadota bacterium]MYI66683.1 hypothetical protein [Gemmatimonadota bacterium]
MGVGDDALLRGERGRGREGGEDEGGQGEAGQGGRCRAGPGGRGKDGRACEELMEDSGFARIGSAEHACLRSIRRRC